MLEALSLIAIVSYAAALTRLCFGAQKSTESSRRLILGFSALGGLAHITASLISMFSGDTADFSLIQSGSLIFSITILLLSASCLRRPLHALFLGLEPIAIVLILASLITPPTKTAQYDVGTSIHIVFSILAYGVVLIAACCAVMLYYGNYLLRHKHIGAALSRLPPLETMDRLLFEIILCCQVLLTLSILSGFIFLDDIFAQHLIHKTFFSLLSWCIYGALLVGHYRFGWRGTQAILWTLAGFVALVFAYVGSKLVLEWIL